MTNKEAINVLFQVKDALINSNSWLESTKEPIMDAFNMAIEALSKSSEIPNSSDDLISRQAAIDVLRGYFDGMLETDTWSPCDVYGLIEVLPSAQPEPIRINLNEPIKVKLTDWGKEIYYHQYDRTNQIAGRKICKPQFPKEDENGYTKFQLWCFIELYGEHIGMTLPNVIEPLEIIYER